MKIEIKGDLILDENNRCIEVVEDLPPDALAELSRRVNGWEELVAFVRIVANECCACLNDKYGTYTCFRCRAREALRKAGV